MSRVFARLRRRYEEVIDAARLAFYITATFWVAGYYATSDISSNIFFALCLLVVSTGCLLSMKAGRKVLFGY